MKAHVMKLENNCVIVDEEYFNEIKKESEFNQEKINEIAEAVAAPTEPQKDNPDEPPRAAPLVLAATSLVQ